MTPIDPIFLLIPILQAAQPVSLLNLMSTLLILSQADGTTGQFRPADHIFEAAASRLSTETKTSAIKCEDIMQLGTLHCVHDALRRICDTKGTPSGNSIP